MKKKLLFLLGLVFIFLIYLAIDFVFLSRRTQEGRIEIVSSPTANVIINDKAVGRTPYTSSLIAGDYVVKLVPDEDGASESASWNGKVNIYHNTRTYISREIGSNQVTSSGVVLTAVKMESEPTKKDTGEIEIRTKPDGGIVFLDDEEQGISPLVLSEVEQGEHELSVFSPGFFRRSQKIKVQDGYRVIAEYSLAIDPTHKKVVKEKKDPTATQAATLTGKPELTPTQQTSTLKQIEILQTDTGWLRVRSEPSVSASESARVNPGTTFGVIEEKSGWYKIEYAIGAQGWISSQYTRPVPKTSL